MTFVKIMVTALLFACIRAVLVSRITEPIQLGSQLRLLDFPSKMKMEEMTDAADATEQAANPSPSPARRTSFVFKNSTVGFIRAAGAGVSVTIGASATLRFSITLEAIQADIIAADDMEFRKKLTKTEDMEYRKLRANYTGGLNIPFMEWIGADLERNVTRADLIRSSMMQENYSSKAFVARQLLTSRTPRKVTLSGLISVTGTSFTPRTFFAFIKAARVRLNDGSSILVVSTNAVDSAAATADGLATASTAESLDISDDVA